MKKQEVKPDAREEQFRRLLGHVCAYCGILKSDRPPTWCVRSHEGYEAKQAKLEGER